MEARSQFQNLDLLKSLMRGNKRLIAEPTPRTPTPRSDIDSLEFSGFGPGPCLDLKPVVTAETAMSRDSCAFPASPPPPYQLHSSPLSPNPLSTDRPLLWTGDNSPRYSTLQAISHASNTSLPIYDTYSGPRPPSTSCSDLAPEHLRNGLRALFQAPTPLGLKDRRSSKATIVSARSVSTLEYGPTALPPSDSPGREAVTGRTSSPSTHSKTTTNNHTTLSEPVGKTVILPTAHHVSWHTSSSFMAELDATERVFTPAELDVTEPVIRPTELSTEAETTPAMEQARTQDAPSNEEEKGAHVNSEACQRGALASTSEATDYPKLFELHFEMIPPSQDTSASGDTSPFTRLKGVDTSAFTSIVTSSRLIGYYPEGQTSGKTGPSFVHLIILI
ncbi:hypothetical protein PGQ11_006073 [Apiospora arundinis]|uniref:Uncharacterized protein n=1 Tax=Apiospora arundinis TaxID=335852 RepID=A0ABR2IS82_9PEZI